MTRKRLLKSQDGFLLVGLIITMVIIAIAGTATYYLTTGSTFSELFKNNNLKAYYLAESGARYAAPLVLSDLNSGTTTNIDNLNNKVFTLSPGQFNLTINNTGTDYTLITSVGTINAGSWLESKRNLVYLVSKPSFNEPFDPATFDKNWNQATGSADVASTGAAPLLGATGLREKAGSTYDIATVSMKWDGQGGVSNPGLPNLLYRWQNSNNLLSYALQIKMALQPQGGKGNYYLIGLSFRLNDQNDGDPRNDVLYGASFFSSLPRTAFSVITAPDWVKDVTFDGIRDGNVYVILWKHSSDNTYTVLDYRLIGFKTWINKTDYYVGQTIIPATANGYWYECTTAGKSGNTAPTWSTTVNNTTTDDGAIWTNRGLVSGKNLGNLMLLNTNGTLRYWSTLAVQIDERYCSNSSDVTCDQSTGTRENFITVYTASPDSSATPATYPRGTINWNYSSYFQLLQWHWRKSSQLLAASPPWTTQTVMDGTLTTVNFDTSLPPEIGIHGYYDTPSNMDIFFDDFSVKFSGSSGSSPLPNGSYVQYY